MKVFGFDISGLLGNRNAPRASGAAMPRSYHAAAVDRLTASWQTGQRAINDELRADLDRLRQRARDLGKNNDYARKFLRMVSRNVVGAAGFILQARAMEAPGKPDSLANKAIEAAWARWCKRGSAEITGRQSFADLQRAVVATVARDGEALIRIVRGDAAANPEGLALQLIDVARIDTARNIAPGAGRNAIIMGIEVDAYTRPLAYWLKERVDGSTGSAVRVPAGDMLHVFLPEDAEQVRGIPWMHAAILALHDLGEFNRSALLAARKSADTVGFIVAPGAEAMAYADEHDGNSEPIKISAPGTYDVIPEGYDIKTPEYNYPNQVYDPFTRSILRRVAAGLDVSAAGLTGDLSDVNFSSIRAGTLDERDQWMTLQNWFAEAFLEPVWEEWFARAMLVGTMVMPNGSALPIVKADKFRAHEWQGRRWPWVDPEKDIKAMRLAIKSGVASPQMFAAMYGVDVEDILDAIAAFEAMRADKKVTLVDYDEADAPITDSAPSLNASP